ncbi:unnamed protein product [Vitrella brassicaformis CCMP3155]|uniref:Uncharacterized protein n=3 Tax=Vitrella brassicaformis TaxID=1169539 RepID=A0A0G4EIC0_VITBC|nr:unnamed protein product [Vitrella brassicaformis CCMP3155]|eukprot:CEL95731.1 unnamed protein product [Vitrella brassicaformis CCMP3155]
MIVRSYWALKDLRTTAEVPTGAVYGLAQSVLKLVRHYKPHHMVAVLEGEDSHRERKEIYPDYKKDRDAQPEDLTVQFPLALKLLDLAGIPTIGSDELIGVKYEGWEADDVIGTLTKKLLDQWDEQDLSSVISSILILSSDKDLWQVLVNDRVKCLLPHRPAGGRGWKAGGPYQYSMTRERLRRELGIEPHQVPDYLALVGDSVDSVEGVKGVGPKTAQKLLQQHGNLEGVLEHGRYDPHVSRKVRLELRTIRQDDARMAQCRRTLQTTTLNTSLPISSSLTDYLIRPPQAQELSQLLDELEMKGTKRQFVEVGMLPPTPRIGNAAPASADSSVAAPISMQTRGFASLSRQHPVVPPLTVPTDHVTHAPSVREAAPSLNGWPDAAANRQSAPEDVMEDTGEEGSSLSSLMRAVEESDPSAVSFSDDAAVLEDGMLSPVASILMSEALVGKPPSTRQRKSSKPAAAAPSLPLKYPPDVDRLHINISFPLPTPSGRICHVSLSPALLSSSGGPIASSLAAALSGPSTLWVSDDIKSVLHGLKAMGMPPLPADRCFDVSVAAWLLEPDLHRQPLAQLMATYLPDSPTTDAPDAPDPSTSLIPLWRALESRLRDAVLWSLWERLERPLIPVLAAMEQRGMPLNVTVLQRLEGRKEGGGEGGEGSAADVIEGELHELAGREFNPRSPAQVGQVLFDDFGMPSVRLKQANAPKTDKSTSVYALKELQKRLQEEVDARGKGEVRDTEAGEGVVKNKTDEEIHRAIRFIDLILDHRDISKQDSGFVVPLQRHVSNTTHRIHCSFLQTGTGTGRLACERPNLQQIPPNVRQAFSLTHDAGGNDSSSDPLVYVAVDYRQMEIDILARLSLDTSLLAAIQTGDVHRETASRLFGVPIDQVTPQQRDEAKKVTYGILYGQTADGLAQQAMMDRAAAKAHIERFFEAFPRVRQLFEFCKYQVRTEGCVSTIGGRKRFFPDMVSARGAKDGEKRKRVTNRPRVDRQASNMVIQGSAADVMKFATLRVADALREHPALDANLVLNLHDELLIEVRRSHIDMLRELISPLLTNAWDDMMAGMQLPLYPFHQHLAAYSPINNATPLPGKGKGRMVVVPVAPIEPAGTVLPAYLPPLRVKWAEGVDWGACDE